MFPKAYYLTVSSGSGSVTPQNYPTAESIMTQMFFIHPQLHGKVSVLSLLKNIKGFSMTLLKSLKASATLRWPLLKNVTIFCFFGLFLHKLTSMRPCLVRTAFEQGLTNLTQLVRGIKRNMTSLCENRYQTLHNDSFCTSYSETYTP